MSNLSAHQQERISNAIGDAIGEVVVTVGSAMTPKPFREVASGDLMTISATARDDMADHVFVRLRGKKMLELKTKPEDVRALLENTFGHGAVTIRHPPEIINRIFNALHAHDLLI